MRRTVPILALSLTLLAVPPATAERASSRIRSAQGGLFGLGAFHTCVVLTDGRVRCWGWGESGRLGYGNTGTIGDDETPASAGLVDLGATAAAVAAGDAHTCAILGDGSVRCWGSGANGRLGYGNTTTIGDTETPGGVGPVDLGPGRTAVGISAGTAHTCAVLDDGSLRCWGAGASGRTGQGGLADVGDDETPGSVAPVQLGAGRTAAAVSAGDAHTCAILDDGTVRCWGFGGNGRLGYGATGHVGDDEPPGSVGPVDLGPGRTAVAIGVGYAHTCVILDDGTVRCWGRGDSGQLGYGSYADVGDNETPGSVGPVNIGAGRTAIAIAAGGAHTCVILDDGGVRCWGFGGFGQLGYGNTDTIGATETPEGFGPVDLGAGRSAVAIGAGAFHTCALLDDGRLRCWGDGGSGRLGYGNPEDIGDNETPASVGPVDIGGLMHGAAGDVSLKVKAKKQVREGRSMRAKVVVANAGPDPASEVRVGVKVGGGLRLRGSKLASFAGGKRVTLGPIPPGGKAVIVLRLDARRPGRATIRARVLSDAELFLDTDSTPGNAAKSEDDDATKKLKVLPL